MDRGILPVKSYTAVHAVVRCSKNAECPRDHLEEASMYLERLDGHVMSGVRRNESCGSGRELERFGRVNRMSQCLDLEPYGEALS